MEGRTAVKRLLTAVVLVVALACKTNVPPDQQVQDAKITAQVKARLLSNVRASTLTNVEVNSSNGLVTLSGTVNTEEEKNAAEQEARAVEGVTKVVNSLQVVHKQKAS
jgi:hyperosmotically inducible protein